MARDNEDANPRGFNSYVRKLIRARTYTLGLILVEPSNTELVNKLGLQTGAQRQLYDAVLIGAGPAGLTAAL